MVKVDVKGCCGFVDEAKYNAYVGKALDAFDVLVAGNGAGNDFLGWKHLPSETPESLIADCEAIRDDWKAKGVDLVVAIGIGGSYLGAKCAIEALSHNFAKQLAKKDAAEVVFAGNNLSEEYLAELMDLAAERNVACIVISKSGTTTEPAVAFRIVKQYLEDTYGKKEAAERIVAITDAKKGALKTLSTQEGYKTFVVPDNVGGRFSVLTPVGILPIVVAGFDVRAILAGALEAEKALTVKSAENPPSCMPRCGISSTRNTARRWKSSSTTIPSSPTSPNGGSSSTASPRARTAWASSPPPSTTPPTSTPWASSSRKATA